MEHRNDTPLEASSIHFYSFWKPNPIPPRGHKTPGVNLMSIGETRWVASEILKIPHMYTVVSTPSFIGHLPVLRFIWDIDKGVMLKVRPECVSTEKTGNNHVFSIDAFSAIPDSKFYSLYIQFEEHFGITLYDEVNRCFMVPKEFKHFCI